jgi:2-polyprenyl-3-methyl-5-hydroxy-6-metoxy-1,4-benzoquinol methylase
MLLPTLFVMSEKLHAIDLNSRKDIVQLNLKKLNVAAELSSKNLTEERYPSDYFHLIVAFSVFEHIKDPVNILKEMRRILRPEGELLVGMPRVDKLMQNLFTLIGFKGINTHHVTSPGAFQLSAKRYFELAEISPFPAHFPASIALYLNMLFKKNPIKSNPGASQKSTA